MKVVINTCYGGFSLSKEATEWIAERGNKIAQEDLEDGFFDGFGFKEHINRTDPDLIAAVEKFKSRANGMHAKLKVVKIPDDIEWTIEEYDGIEWVAEKHRTWG